MQSEGEASRLNGAQSPGADRRFKHLANALASRKSNSSGKTPRGASSRLRKVAGSIGAHSKKFYIRGDTYENENANAPIGRKTGSSGLAGPPRQFRARG